MKKALLTISLSLLMISGWSQTLAHLDSSYHYRMPDTLGAWQYVLREVYDPHTPDGVTKVNHYRQDQMNDTIVWTILCEDSISTGINYRAHYTLDLATRDTFYLIRKEQKKLYPDGKLHVDEIQKGEVNGFPGNGSTIKEFTYTSDGQLETESQFYWDERSLSYRMHSRMQYAYDTHGRAIVKTIERLYRGTFDFLVKEQYTYDADGKIVQIDFANWDNGRWVPNSQKLIKRYAQNGELITEYRQMQGSNGQFVTYDSTQYEYDRQGRLRVETTFINSPVGINPSLRIEYLLSQDGLTETVVNANFENGSWVERIRNEKVNNPEGLLLEQTYTDSRYPHNNFYIKNYYSEKQVSVEPAFENACRLPNPLRPTMSLSCGTLDPMKPYKMVVTDLQGRLIVAEKVRYGQPLSFLEGLSNQLYMVQLFDQDAMIFLDKIVILAE